MPVRTHAHTSRSLLALPCFTLQFMGWAKLVCEKLDAKGHWSDYMDPCSGLAVRPAPPSLCAVPSRTEFNVLSCGGACGVLRCTAAHLAANPAIALTRTQVRTKECNSPYGEVEALGTLLGYSTANAGCCKVILHPKWGSSIYPSSLFTKAPVEDLLQAIKEVEADPAAQAL